MKYLVIAIVVIVLILFFVGRDKQATEEDFKAAKKLGISTRRARLYREIFDEQLACYDRGEEPPDRTSEIPNMNEWRRYGEYRENEFSVREVYEKHKSQWDNEKKQMLHSIGETVILPVEGEGDVEGTIIGYEKGFYQVRFPFAVSIMPAKEPEGGWSDNDWPDEIQLLSDGMIDEIMNGILIGTTVHYHF